MSKDVPVVDESFSSDLAMDTSWAALEDGKIVPRMAGVHLMADIRYDESTALKRLHEGVNFDARTSSSGRGGPTLRRSIGPHRFRLGIRRDGPNLWLVKATPIATDG